MVLEYLHDNLASVDGFVNVVVYAVLYVSRDSDVVVSAPGRLFEVIGLMVEQHQFLEVGAGAREGICDIGDRLIGCGRVPPELGVFTELILVRVFTLRHTCLTITVYLQLDHERRPKRKVIACFLSHAVSILTEKVMRTRLIIPGDSGLNPEQVESDLTRHF